MNTPQAVKNWYLNDSFNSKSKNTSNLVYKIACLISPSIISVLMLRQKPKQVYLGSNLEVVVYPNNTESYRLLFYTYIKDTKTGLYLVGRTDYILKDVVIKDYKDYINSKNFYYLAISENKNLESFPLQNTQAIKTDSFVANQSVIFNTDNIVSSYLSSFELLTDKVKTLYLTTMVDNSRFYNNTPSDTLNFVSRTPSTLVFADSIEKKLK